MTLFFSFILSFVSYLFVLILLFFMFNSSMKEEKSKQLLSRAYVHQAIKKEEIKEKKSLMIKKKVKVKEKAKVNKEVQDKVKIEKKVATNSDFSQGGEKVSFNDLFEGVSTNVKSNKVKIKKSAEITQKKSNFSKEIKQNLNEIEIKRELTSLKKEGDTQDIAYIEQMFGNIWDKYGSKKGEVVVIRVKIKKGIMTLTILRSSLKKEKLEAFMTELNQINTAKIEKLSTTITFNTKELK